MPRSRVLGVEKFRAELNRKADASDIEMARANREAAFIVQRHVVPKVPVLTGQTRDAFADPTAVGLSRKFKGGWRFGLITPELRKRGFKAHWIEFGTKGYSAGEKRVYDRLDKKGRPTRATKKITRDVPARAAQPFFRPGVASALGEIEAVYREAARRALKAR